MEELNTVKIWSEVLDNIKVNVSSAIFKTWFSQTHLAGLTQTGDKYSAEIGCNSTFVKSTLESRYFGLIQDSLSIALNSQSSLTFIVKDNPQKKLTDAPASPLFEERDRSGEITEAIMRANLRPSFNFESFAVSSSNQMAYAAADAVSKNLGTAYNPLFIWGGVGVGKTHLMSAVGHHALNFDSNYNMLFSTGEQFTNDIVEGIRNKSTQQVRQKYRKLKVLMIDDIQFIAGKDTVQEEFFHTFNALVAVGSQVILTSDRPPSEISKLEERLRSRFEAGLIVDIAPPDFELRCAIVQIKAKQRGIDLPMDMVQLIAANVEGARKIEGALVRLASEVLLKKSDINMELIESIIGASNETNGARIKANPTDVVTSVAKFYSLKKRSLLGASRARPLARPRQILMYLLRKELDLPLQEVGKVVGRDHTTVMHAVDKITTLALSDVNIREDIAGIKKII